MRLLIVEDCQQFACKLMQRLKRSYIVDVAHSAQAGLIKTDTTDYQALIIDIGLPDWSGFELIKQLRSENFQTPILILSALSRVEHKAKGLTIGADDYLAKPFSWSELEARLKALLRRKNTVQTPTKLKAGCIELNTWNNTVMVNNQPATNLSKKECLILECLLRNQGRIVSTHTLRQSAWDKIWTESNTVQVHINRLRKKLAPFNKNLIQTIYGQGYLIKK